jgi:putative NADH-flavin reductase
MKLIVFGATGGTGRQVVAQALSAGHTVTAVARHPEALALRHDRLMVLRGDVLEPAMLAQPLAGQDAVVSALGVRSRAPTTVFSSGISNIMQAMKAGGVRRLICISAAGLDPGPGLLRTIAKSILYRMLRHAYNDMGCMEALVKESGLDWTIIRAPMLTNKPRTGEYQIATNQHLSRGASIARADLADYIVTHLVDPGSYRALVEIATS